jgi:hypothetical protein
MEQAEEYPFIWERPDYSAMLWKWGTLPIIDASGECERRMNPDYKFQSFNGERPPFFRRNQGRFHPDS